MPTRTEVTKGAEFSSPGGNYDYTNISNWPLTFKADRRSMWGGEMLKIATMFIICAAWAVTARSQERFDPVGEAGGGVWLRQGWDPWCVLDAQALLSPAGHARLGVAHSPGAFGLGELSASAAAVAFPLGAGGAGVAVTRFGYALYSEHSGVIAFGGGTGPMRFGAGIRYTRISIRGYGSTGMAGLDFTVLVAPLQWMRCGLRLTDVN